MYTTYKLKLQNRIKCLGFTGNGILTKEYIAKKRKLIFNRIFKLQGRFNNVF